MEFMWYLVSFDKSARTVILESDCGELSADDFCSDINKLQSLAIDNNACTSDVLFSSSEDSCSVSIKAVFTDEGDWKKFCKDFMTLQTADNQSESE